ncbi:hypothetical protein PR048_021713 [Dryococelus australis]|uniref:Uncharacterized protein n=1 Tax=Dryococelus australis TaxID=614101 RepID=A0ABQ9GZ22_9NEOP|nr:hypothetical protein PR048_021713 [Dryococelus australis]
MWNYFPSIVTNFTGRMSLSALAWGAGLTTWDKAGGECEPWKVRAESRENEGKLRSRNAFIVYSRGKSARADRDSVGEVSVDRRAGPPNTRRSKCKRPPVPVEKYAWFTLMGMVHGNRYWLGGDEAKGGAGRDGVCEREGEFKKLILAKAVEMGDRGLNNEPMMMIEVSMERRRNEGAGETGDPREKINRPTASSRTIPTCENPMTRPEAEPGSPWWEHVLNFRTFYAQRLKATAAVIFFRWRRWGYLCLTTGVAGTFCVNYRDNGTSEQSAIAREMFSSSQAHIEQKTSPALPRRALHFPEVIFQLDTESVLLKHLGCVRIHQLTALTWLRALEKCIPDVTSHCRCPTSQQGRIMHPRVTLSTKGTSNFPFSEQGIVKRQEIKGLREARDRKVVMAENYGGEDGGRALSRTATRPSVKKTIITKLLNLHPAFWPTSHFLPAELSEAVDCFMDARCCYTLTATPGDVRSVPARYPGVWGVTHHDPPFTSEDPATATSRSQRLESTYKNLPVNIILVASRNVKKVLGQGTYNINTAAARRLASCEAEGEVSDKRSASSVYGVARDAPEHSRRERLTMSEPKQGEAKRSRKWRHCRGQSPRNDYAMKRYSKTSQIETPPPELPLNQACNTGYLKHTDDKDVPACDNRGTQGTDLTDNSVQRQRSPNSCYDYILPNTLFRLFAVKTCIDDSGILSASELISRLPDCNHLIVIAVGLKKLTGMYDKTSVVATTTARNPLKAVHDRNYYSGFLFSLCLTINREKIGVLVMPLIPGRVTPDFRMWESCRTMPLVGGFSRGSPVFPILSFRRCSILTSITLIGSQDLDVKSRQNIFTHSLSSHECGALPLWCLAFLHDQLPVAERGCWTINILSQHARFTSLLSRPSTLVKAVHDKGGTCDQYPANACNEQLLQQAQKTEVCVLKSVHDKVSAFEINLRKKSLALPACILSGALRDMGPETISGGMIDSGDLASVTAPPPPLEKPTSLENAQEYCGNQDPCRNAAFREILGDANWPSAVIERRVVQRETSAKGTGDDGRSRDDGGLGVCGVNGREGAKPDERSHSDAHQYDTTQSEWTRRQRNVAKTSAELALAAASFPPGIERGAPWKKASGLTTKSPRSPKGRANKNQGEVCKTGWFLSADQEPDTVQDDLVRPLVASPTLSLAVSGAEAERKVEVRCEMVGRLVLGGGGGERERPRRQRRSSAISRASARLSNADAWAYRELNAKFGQGCLRLLHFSEALPKFYFQDIPAPYKQSSEN